MKQLLPLLLTAAALLTVLLFGGCADGSSTDSGGEPFQVESITTDLTTALTSRTTQAETTVTTEPQTSSETVTTTTTKPTVVGKWVLDSTVQDGTVRYKDGSEHPPIAYRYTLQYEFTKSGKARRIHPLYAYSEEGTWSYGEKGTSRVTVEFPYHEQFNPLEEPEELCFEQGNLFTKAPPAGVDYYFARVSEFPEVDPVRAAEGKAALSVSGFWECAWVTADGETITDKYDGVDVRSVKMEIPLGGECILHRNNSPDEAAAYALVFLSDNSLELRLVRTKNPRSTIGQMEGTLELKKGYLVWRYNDSVVYCFRSISAEEFRKAMLLGSLNTPAAN
ncbi:MAG: hypothetical protein IK107_02135 [Oscillospiraceae bacterium]|nr:hypothetical protein [Oscillospiraceae bacterium]